MKAIIFYKSGDSEGLQFNDVDIIKPNRIEVLFKVKAFAQNQADIHFFSEIHYTMPNFLSRIDSEATDYVYSKQ